MENNSEKQIFEKIYNNLKEIKNKIIKSEKNNQLQMREIQKNMGNLNTNYNKLSYRFSEIDQ